MFAAHEIDAVEMSIISQLLRNALDRGYTISVRDETGNLTIMNGNQLDDIILALHGTAIDVVSFKENTQRMGWIRLIYGNGGDIISDYAYTPEMVSLVESIEGK